LILLGGAPWRFFVLPWGETAKGAARASVVTPRGDHFSRVFEAVKPVRVEAFVSEPVVEALDEGVVDGPTRSTEVKTA
jgi:hypothetical protein